MEKEYNIIDEPWICVKTDDCKVVEVSLKEAILNANSYVELSGETKTQDFAILRLILAIMHTVFSRYDEDGNELDISENTQDLLTDRWKNIWNLKHIPPVPIEKYLSKWYDRFWLFSDEYPFYQATSVNGENGKPYDTSKMIGSLSESGHKPRLFSDRFHEGRLLSYSEATRWLLHLNCFDDIASKNPTPKKTWVSQLGLIAVKGKNLFETIMLNYNPELDEESFQKPSWEQDNNHIEYNRSIAVPNNQAELLSLMSRRIYLHRENSLVNGYYIKGGDYFEEQDIDEQMTLWKSYKEKRNSDFKFKPKLYDTSKKIWQEFGIITNTYYKEDNKEERIRCSGVIHWIELLKDYEILSEDYIVNLSLASVIYNYGQAASLPVIDLVSDSLTFHSELLMEAGGFWNDIIKREIERCESVAKQLVILNQELKQSAGASDSISNSDIKVQFYDKIDRVFRVWLFELNPNKQNKDDYKESYCKLLEVQVYNIAVSLGNQLAIQTGIMAIFGGKKSSAKAINKFLGCIKRHLPLINDKNDE